jgi:large subunit ribosomal protein L21e
MPHSHGYRIKTRSRFRKRKLTNPVSPFLRQYDVGSKAIIAVDPSQTKGMPHRRFQGLVGEIVSSGRRALTLKIQTGNKAKYVTARLEHVKPYGEGD